jgi:hypothetical protein
MEEEPKKKVLVSGPVNVLRLEGHVGDVKKVVYLFFDHHLDHGDYINGQSECTDRQAIDFKRYIFENLENRTSDMPVIDIFLETFQYSVIARDNTNRSTKNKYLLRFRSYFYDLFKNRNDSKTINNVIDHIRVHYIDIRDYITVLHAANKLYPRQISVNDPILIPYLANRCKIRRQIIDLLEKTTYSYTKLSIPENYVPYDVEIPLDVAIDRLNNYFDKIKYRYKHDEVRNKLWRRFQYVLYMQYDVIWKADKMISFILDARATPNEKKLSTSDLTYYSGVTSHGEDNLILREKWIGLQELDGENGFASTADVWLMDLYTMRRLLDKDEITNVVIYTGGLHSTNYVKMLVRDFDFKITHASYTKERNMDKLNQDIKTSPEYMTEYLINQSVYSMRQCSDLTDFPEHFQ